MARHTSHRATKNNVKCVALTDVTKIRDTDDTTSLYRSAICDREAKPGRPLCEAHVALLTVSDVMILADDDTVYVLKGGGI